MRPGFVLVQMTNLMDMIEGLAPSVRVDVLAAVMIHVALNGIKHQIMENTAIGRQSIDHTCVLPTTF